MATTEIHDFPARVSARMTASNTEGAIARANAIAAEINDAARAAGIATAYRIGRDGEYMTLSAGRGASRVSVRLFAPWIAKG